MEIFVVILLVLRHAQWCVSLVSVFLPCSCRLIRAALSSQRLRFVPLSPSLPLRFCSFLFPSFAMSADAGTVKELQAQVKLLQLERAELQAQIQELEAASTASGLHEKIDELVEELRALTASHEEALDRVAMHETELAGERNRAADLEATLEALQANGAAAAAAARAAPAAGPPGGARPGRSDPPSIGAHDDPSRVALDALRQQLETQHAETLESVHASYQETIANMSAQFSESLATAQQSYASAQQQVAESLKEQAVRMQQLTADYSALQVTHAQCEGRQQQAQAAQVSLSAAVSTLQSQLATVESAKRQLEESLHAQLKQANAQTQRDQDTIARLEEKLHKLQV